MKKDNIVLIGMPGVGKRCGSGDSGERRKVTA